MTNIRQWLKSWTINFGLLLQVAAMLQVYVEGHGNPVHTMIIGIVIIGLRFKTTESLKNK